MARRNKRASMREGPLADLFRSTSDDAPHDPPEAPRYGRDDPAEARKAEQEAPPVEPPRAEEPPAPAPVPKREPEGELEPAPFVAGEPGQESSETAPERLKRVFSEEPTPRREEYLPGSPRYGREEPAYQPPGSGEPHQPVIKVVGVGGAGVNAVNRMVDARIPGVEFMAVNTDLQSLQLCVADVTIHIGDEQTRGLGAGADTEVGHRSAFDEQDKIKRLLKGSDMVFITCGAGGGTGTGAAPVIARLARDVGALAVGIVTKPFGFEGTRRAKQADDGIQALSAEVDTLIVVPNERLLTVLAKTTTMVEAFQVADDVLRQGVQGISELITLPGMINLDFADVRTTMRDAGRALLGIGMGSSDNRAVRAAESAVSSPLLETSVEGAQSILLSITGGPDLTLLEVSEAAKIVQEAAHPDANIIFGANIDDSVGDEVWITVIATRFDGQGRRADRSATGERRAIGSSEAPRRPAERRPSTSKPRPHDFDLDVPEYVPGR
ncbi:MAG: cell division protein FtsZ [Gaiellaceae bacterium]|nr:cell division protein FtsZ [Gaiellaceae bacterium]